jgi:pimeloyl-ACP methyl ester carboxylesterase
LVFWSFAWSALFEYFKPFVTTNSDLYPSPAHLGVDESQRTTAIFLLEPSPGIWLGPRLRVDTPRIIDMKTINATIRGIGISSDYLRLPRTPVLLVHGNSSCKQIFKNQIGVLRKLGHTILVPDLPGHGGSANARTPRSTYSFPGYADILTGLLDRLEIDRCHVVGWSLGGHIGLELWHRDPRIASLTISGTPPVKLSPQGALDGFLASPVMNLAGARIFDEQDVVAYGTAMLGHRLDRRTHLARMIARTDGRARYWMLRNSLTGSGVDQVEAVQSCRRPLAIIQGRHDPFVNIDYLNGLTYRNLWLGRPILINAGHAPHWEQPQIFNRYLSRFLKEFDW